MPKKYSAAFDIDDIDKKLLSCLQEKFPLVLRPFQKLGKKFGLSEEEVISRIKRLKSLGIIKRIGPIHNPEASGLKRTLIGMSAPEDKLKKAVEIINSFKEVTHNYLRKDNTFNLWFTLICPTQKRINEIIRNIKQRSGIKAMVNLPTIKMIKIKTIFRA